MPNLGTPQAPFGVPGQMFRDLAQQQAAQSGQWQSPFSALMGKRTGTFKDLNGPQLQQTFAAKGQMGKGTNTAGANQASLMNALAFR